MVRVRLPLGAILLALCSIALASSGGDTAPRRDNGNLSRGDNAAASLQSHGDAAALSYSSFLRKQESISLPFVYLRDSENGGFAAANGKQPSARSALIIRSPLRAMDSRLRGNDGIMGGLDSRLRGNDGLLGDDAWRGLFMDVANGGNNSDAFDNFYKMAQLRMLSALDDSLSAFAADALYDNDAVKSAGIRFQSPLGGRKAQLGADIIGAMDERHDETNQYAIGWQLHLYAAEKGNKGASGGFFYRRITNNILYGVNIFADYEDHDYGEFYRWGLGGELKNKHVKFAANYYLPVGGDKTINSTVLAYSREGYDANLQIAIPGAQYLQAEAAYYYYAGKQKGEEDKGFRYGAALSPGAGVVVKVFYDDGGDDFGGELSWHYLFNNPGQKDPQRHDTPNISSADLFAPVLREYSQRIALATLGTPMPGFGIIARQVLVNNPVVVATLNIPAGYFDSPPQVIVSSSLPSDDIALSDSLPLVSITYTPSAANVIGALTIIAQGTIRASLAEVSFAMTVTSFAGFVAAFDNPPVQFFITNAAPGTVGIVSGMGGVMPYQYRGEGVMVNSSGVVLFDRGGEREITAAIIVGDNSAQTPDITIRTILTALAISDPIMRAASPFVVGAQSPAATIILQGGGLAGDAPTGFAIQSNTILLFNASSPLNGFVQTMIITNAVQTLTTAITLTAFAPIGGSFGGYHSSIFVNGVNGTVGTIAVSGGGGDYVYNAPSGAGYAFAVDSGGVIRFSAAMAVAATATIIADDAFDITAPISVMVTVSAFAGPCAFIEGCAHFGHARRTIPTLPVATMMARAGVNVNDEVSNLFSAAASARRAVISDFTLVRFFLGIGTDQGLTDIIGFLVAHGADIDYQVNGSTLPASYDNGQTPLDRCNDISAGTERTQCRATLLLHNARCNRNCDMNDTDITGQVCTRNTGRDGVPRGADCRP